MGKVSETVIANQTKKLVFLSSSFIPISLMQLPLYAYASSDDKLPLCDGTYQDCVTENGHSCKAGNTTDDACECRDDMSNCQNSPLIDECRDAGYRDGQNNPFNQEKNNECRFIDNQYYKGFIDGCMDAGNTREICELFTDE